MTELKLHAREAMRKMGSWSCSEVSGMLVRRPLYGFNTPTDMGRIERRSRRNLSIYTFEMPVSPFPEAKPFVVDVDDDLPVR